MEINANLIPSEYSIRFCLAYAIVDDAEVEHTAKRLVPAICDGLKLMIVRAGTMMKPPPRPRREPMVPAAKLTVMSAINVMRSRTTWTPSHIDWSRVYKERWIVDSREELRIILIGFGVVGQNLAKLLLSRNEDLYALYGMKPRIVAVVDSRGSAISTSGLDLHMLLDAKKTKGSVSGYGDGAQKDVQEIIESVDAEVVVEMTQTNLKTGEPGMANITNAIKNGRNVITTNKGPLALALPSLIELAEYNDVILRFSGTVGGGTPILEFAKRCLKGDRIVSFRGILNGTTNYILTRMEEGLSFIDALNDAKEKGYAEADPSLDIDGYDAAAKLVIMANWVMSMKVTMKDVNFTGIRNVTVDQMKGALKNHNAIKLIAASNKGLTVKPTEIPKNDPLCVNGTLNAVTFSSEYSGQQTIIGRGAGGMETASAVLRDLIEIREAVGKV